MEVKDIKIFKDKKTNDVTGGYCKTILFDRLSLNTKIVVYDKGYFCKYAEYKGSDGKYYEGVYFLSKEDKEKVSTFVINAFKKQIEFSEPLNNQDEIPY